MRFTAFFSWSGVFYASCRIYFDEDLAGRGARFRTLRKQARKTQRELAAATGMRQEAISRFEAGSASDFSLNKLLTLLQALDLEFDFKPAVRRPDLDDLLAERRGRLDDAKDPS